MSCNATASDKNNLHKGHYSTRVLAPTGGGQTSISLGGGYGSQPSRTNQQRGVRRGPQGVTNQNKTTMSMGGVGQAKPRQGGVRRNVNVNKGAAGGSASLSNSGGYGNLDIHSKPSSRVLSQPGGGSSNIFGGPTQSTKKGGVKKTQRSGGTQQRGGGGRGQQRGGGGRGQQRGGGGRGQQRGGGRGRGAAGGSGSLSNTGGYGNLDIHSKASSRVLAQPGGGSSNIFGGATEKKTKLNQSQRRAKESLQSNVFGAPTGGNQRRGVKTSKQPGGGQSMGGSQRKGVRVGQQPGGGQSQSRGQKSSTRIMQSTGGNSNVQLGGAGRGQMKSSTRVTNKGGGQGIFAPGGRGQTRSTTRQTGGGQQSTGQSRVKSGVRRAPQQQRGAAGGSGSVKNSGGYGNLDIHSKPSTRVHAPPGGKSNMPF